MRGESSNSKQATNPKKIGCVLDLVLRYKWYDMILRGEKLEEYRDIEKWYNRILEKGYTHVRFRRGYTKTSLLFCIESISVGMGHQEWGAPESSEVVIIKFKEDKS